MTKLIAVSLMLMMQGSLPKICGPNRDEQCVAMGLPQCIDAHTKECSMNAFPNNLHIDAVEPSTSHGAISIESKTGRVDRISDNEYARLQKLRRAVADAEAEIAKDHGVDTVGEQRGVFSCTETCPTPKLPDRYEFRGQYMLVNVPEASHER